MAVSRQSAQKQLPRTTLATLDLRLAERRGVKVAELGQGREVGGERKQQFARPTEE